MKNIENLNNSTFKASYGKIMMWIFLFSDSLTFMGFLVAYGLFRYQDLDSWPIADEVFTHFPFVDGSLPMLYVALMTFILIMSSVTMVIAVHYGKERNKNKVVKYLGLTIIGGLIFLGSQAWEWGHFIHGSHGSIKLKDLTTIHVLDEQGHKVALSQVVGSGEENPSLQEVKTALSQQKNLRLRNSKREIFQGQQAQELLADADKVVYGASLVENEYGQTLFANCFFFITGFHGFHVFTGVLLNLIIFINVLLGTYEKRKSYEMVEKVGLYWHFVDLVWVFIFTFFYLI